MSWVSIRLLAVVVVTVALPACSTPSRLPAVPAERTTEAQVPGLPGIRYFVDIQEELLLADGIASVEREVAARTEAGLSGSLPPASYLAVSGGGDNGAYGAGLLVGWSDAGTRPDFKIVTGVSTGALTAPFAFLGSDYDEPLRAVYTTISTVDVAARRGLLAALYDDALADNAPLFQLVKSYADETMLQRIAEEYAKGRILLIATTNLDARRPVVWNIGAIAASGQPNALELFHSILVASAAIPGAFPPVMVDVELDGETYQEMHVDGGTMSQVVLYPPSLNLREESEALGFERERVLFLIRNARLDPEWASVDRRTVDIAGRAVSTLIHSQGIGDLYRLYLVAGRDGVDYNLAYIPQDFDAPRTEEFDSTYMNALFDLGYQLGRDGYPWETVPPGFDETELVVK